MLVSIFIKETPPLIFLCEFSKIFYNRFFTEHLRLSGCEYLASVHFYHSNQIYLEPSRTSTREHICKYS